MALQSSGAISLNDMHVEAGGGSGSSCTINDSDIRGLISKGSAAQMAFNEWYGASAVIWALTMTVGYLAGKSETTTGFTINHGSLSDTSCDFKSGAACNGLWFLHSTYLYFQLGSSQTNADFTNMKLTTSTGGVTNWARTSASFASGPGQSRWYWSTGSNPIGSSSTTCSIEFT